METDISSREDIYLIISEFYKKLLSDDLMLPFFEEIIAENSLENHLEIITDFWQDIVFDSSICKNNTMQKHLDKNAFVKFERVHFTRWISYFFETIDALFTGVNTDKIKARATSIATVMQLKMNLYKK